MQLVQKHLPKKSNYKILVYLVLAILLVSCKPFAFSQGFGFAFDYRVGISRIQRAGNWLVCQVSTDMSSASFRGDKK